MERSLSQSERLEIQKVLAASRDRKIAALSAADPGWERRVEERKVKAALSGLRVEKEAVELKKIEDAIRALKNKKAEIELSIAKKMPLKPRDRYSEDGCPAPKSLCEAVASVCREIHESELAKDVTGRKSLAIHAQYESGIAALALCDTRGDVAAKVTLQ